jgi:hypothetical protein
MMPGKCRVCRLGCKWYVTRPLHSLEGLILLRQITPPGKEERALGVMKVLDDALPDVKVRGGSWVDRKSNEKRVGFGMF